MQEALKKLLRLLFVFILIPLTLNAQPQKAFNSFGILLETGAPNLGFSYFGSNSNGWGGYGTLSISIFTGVKEDYVYENGSGVTILNQFDD